MSKAIAVLFLLFSTFGVSYLTLVNGWGLEVKSWGWLIGGYFAVLVLHGMVNVVNKE